MKSTRFQKNTALILLLIYGHTAFPILPLCLAVAATEKTRSAPDLPPPVRTRQNVKVNRTAPAAVTPPARPVLSATPTVQEIFRARVMAEPFVPAGPAPTADESAALAGAIKRYLDNGGTDSTPFVEFTQKHPASAWTPSVQLNLGLHWFAAGEFSQAITAYAAAWAGSKQVTDLRGKAVADRAVAELLQMHARLGRVDALEMLFAEIGDRVFTGRATELVAGAKAGLGLMHARPDLAFRCGPSALDRILARTGRKEPSAFALLRDAPSTAQGVNLAEVLKLSQAAGLNLQAARRSPGATLPTPAVVHWKLGHYAALFAVGDGFRVEDPTFGADMFATADTLDREASGYFLIPAGPLPAGWSPVSTEEAAQVWGKGNTTSVDTNQTTADSAKGRPEASACGMAIVNFHLMVVSLNLTDTPMGYRPPYGPGVWFTATYNQREASQPTTPDFSNLGTKWVHNWLSFIDEARVSTGGANYSYTPTIRLPGGGSEVYTTATNQSSTFPGPYAFPHQQLSQTLLEKTGATTYVRTEPDGSQLTFGHRTGAAGSYRYLLTEIADPTGQALTLAYDGSDRLTSVTDALGQVTTLDYTLMADPLKITKVTDPFGRYATFAYDGSGRLTDITDVIGITSTFAYQSTSDFVASLTTPYGTSTFTQGDSNSGRDRWLELTDPLGDTERVECRSDWSGLPAAGPAPSTGMSVNTGYQNYRNTLHWDRKAWKERPNDPAAARIYHWLHRKGAPTTASGVLENRKQPFENRVWFNYAGQATSLDEGDTDLPSKVGRVLDDSTEQIFAYEYNGFGRVTKSIDPLARETRFIYDANDLDLLEVRQKTGAGGNDYEILSKATYNGAHQVLTATDAAGQVTTSTYNPAGQISTVTNAKSEVTSFFYDPDGDPAGSRLGGGARDPDAVGYLVAVDGPLAGTSDETTFEYDGYGRVAIVTDSEGYVVETDYDDLNRPTLVTYPDSTTQQIVYDRLDAVATKDRRGHISRMAYNALRQLVTSTDPLGRVTQFGWCKCGDLRLLVDPAGNRTMWTHDFQGRVTAKSYPDNTMVRYGYETTTSRLKTVTDAKGQVATHLYFKDNLPKEISYTGAVSTPTVSWTYDSVYPRVATMVDGVGTTTYAYHDIPDGPSASPGVGDGQLASVDGPWASDTIAYGYDELGRVVERTINTTANETDISYDTLGRVHEIINPLGTFTYTYVNATGRLEDVTYPNGQVTNYSYYNNAGDQRLQQIENLKPNSSNLSTFTYTYDADGTIQAWTRKYDAGSVLTSNFKYDAADQLTEASVPSVASVLKEFVYRYDKAGNRTSEQVDSTSLAHTINTLNQVTAMAAGGPIRFEGSLNEPGTVTVGGVVAEVAGDDSFKVDVPLSPGTPIVTVAAIDAASNPASQDYDVPVGSASSRSLAYDLNGNTTNNGDGQTYEWDSADRLTKITYTGGARTEFTYDGLDRRVKIVEKNSGGSTTSEKRFVWDGVTIAEERDGSNALTKRFYGQGVMVGSDEFYYTTDHLRSIRELTDDTGAIEARYDYDPYGRIAKVSGSGDADFRFTGHYFHITSGLHLAMFRAYDADLAKWLSRDPISESGGVNLYEYSVSQPLSLTDPLGLEPIIGFQNGKSVVASSLAEFRRALRDAEDYSIVSIRFDGGKGNEHANPAQQAIAQPLFFPADVIEFDSTLLATVMLTEGNSSSRVPFVAALRKKLAPWADIYLTGCSAGAGQKSLAERLSKEIGEIYPNVTISANTNDTMHFGGRGMFFAKKITFKNGQPIKK